MDEYALFLLQKKSPSEEGLNYLFKDIIASQL